MTEGRESARLVKTAKGPDAAALPASGSEQTEAAHTYDLERLAASLPELQRKPKEIKTDWLLRLIDFVSKELNGHEGLTIPDPESYRPEKLLESINQVITYRQHEQKKAAEQQKGVVIGRTEDGEPIYAKSEAFKNVKTYEKKPIEDEITGALKELHEEAKAEKEQRQAVDQALEKNIKETRDAARAKNKKGYGQQITDLNNKMRREKSDPEERVRSGMVLIEDYDNRLMYEVNARRREELLKKRQAVEQYLESHLPKDLVNKKRDLTRQAAQITLARTHKFEDLNAPIQLLGDEKFKEITRQEWAKDLVVHGIIQIDRHGDVYIKRESDLDGKVALFLLRSAGIDAKFQNAKVKYVAAGESKRGKINIDTGERDGLVVEDGGRTAYFDHHTVESGHEQSASKEVYETLVRLGMLEDRKTLDRLVEFVTRCDNLDYPREAYGPKSYNTMVGLRNFLKPRDIVKFIRDGRHPFEAIPDDELKGIVALPEKKDRNNGRVIRPAKTLYDISQDRLKNAQDSEKKLQEMEKQGLVIPTKEYGKVVIDIGGQVKNRVDAVKAYGAGAFVKWMPENNSFFVTTIHHRLGAKFSQGKPVRDTMWIKPRTDDSKLTTKLGEVVSQFAGAKFEPTGELKKYLQRETVKDAEALEIEKLEAELRNKLGELFTRKLEAQGMNRAEIATLKKSDPQFRSLWEQGINTLYKKYYK